MKSPLIVVFLFLFYLPASAQRIAVLGALDQEIAILLDSLKNKKVEQYGGLTFYTGILKGQAVVLAKSGVGKVNAAYSTAILLDHFTPKQLIFTGVAGGLHPESLPGDVVVGTKLVQTDFGQIDSLGFKVSPFRKLSGGQHEELFIYSDSVLVQQAMAASREVDLLPISNRTPRIFEGVIATSDVFVSNPTTATQLFTDYHALATEMEGAAVAHLCRTLGVPFVVLRSCSDNANQSARLSFNQFVGPAARNSAGIVLQLLQRMN